MSDSDHFPIERSSYYQRYLLEQDELMKLKWIESEKAGRDIGYHRAYWIWNFQHRKQWIESMRASGIEGF